MKKINKKIHNKHDTAIRRILMDKEEAVIYINKILNPEVKITKSMIEPCDNRFITESFYNRETDIIYKIRGTETYILIEHQSKNDYNMPRRIAEYEMEIIIKEIENRSNKLPNIIAIVLYTGNDKWRAPTKIEEMQEDILKKGILGIGNYIIDEVNTYKEDELLNEKGILSKIILIDKAKSKEKIKEVYEKINRYKFNNKEKRILREYTCNIAEKYLTKEEIVKLKEEYREGGEKEMITDVIDREIRIGRKRGREEGRKEGRKEGIKEGIKEGRIKEKKDIAKEMLRSNTNIELIKLWTKLTDEQLNEITID